MSVSQKPTVTQVTRFIGSYRFLSNFWLSAVKGPGGLVYPTVEHAYQASKSADPQDWAAIKNCGSPGDAKRLGKRVALRPDHDQLAVMRSLLEQKFTPGTLLANRLLETGDAILVEGNVWGDRYWGQYCGEGQNHLGRLLMDIRSQLQHLTKETPSE